MVSFDDFLSTMKHNRLRLTPQGIAICEIHGKINFHTIAMMIYELGKARYPSLSLKTIYNTINTLVDLGMVNRLGGAGDNQVHYDGNVGSHINLTCISCHKIVDITAPLISILDREINITSGD